ncbi:unnamed protein product [Schistosoma rodhaini]|uniref:TGF-beta family profile domain-containing protein n=1 Tax=Schistosoma rodhaini TaxID=6188 RepID=A0AA85EMB0_9TREM|nr:unnamed protein product [Schistosoma rodhaini]
METEKTKLYNLTPSTLIFLKTSNLSRLSIEYYFTILKIISVYKFQKIFDYVFENFWQLKYYSTKQFGSYLILSIRKTLILNRICKCIKHLIDTNVNDDDGNGDDDDDDDYVEREQLIKSSILQSNQSKPVKFLSLPYCTTNVLSKKNSKKVRTLSRVNFFTCLIWIIIIVFSCTIKTIEAIEQLHHSTQLSNEYHLINLLQSLSIIGKQMNSNILTKSEQKTWNYLLEKIIKSQINMVKNNLDVSSNTTTTISSINSSSSSSIDKKGFKNNDNNIQKPSKEELIAKTPNYMFKLHERHMNDWYSFGRYETNHLLHPDYVKYLNDNPMTTDNNELYKEKKLKTQHNRHYLGMITAIRHHKHIETQEDENNELDFHSLSRSKHHMQLPYLNYFSADHTVKQHKLVFQLADIPSNEKLVAASIRIRYEAKMYSTNYTIPTELTPFCINNTINNEINSTSFYWPLSLWLHSDQNNISNVDIQTAAIFEPDNIHCILQKSGKNSSIMNLPNGWFHIPLSQPVLHLIEQINKQTDTNKQIVIQIRSVVRKNLSLTHDFDATNNNHNELEQSNFLKISNLNEKDEKSLDSSYWLHNAPHLFTYHRDPNLAKYLKRKPRSINYPNSQHTRQNEQNHDMNLKPLNNNNVSNKKIAKRYKRLQRLLNAQLKQQQQQKKSETNQQSVRRNKQNYIKQRSRRLAQYQRRHNRASQDRYYYGDLDSTNEIVEDHDINEDISSNQKITHNSYDNNRENHHSQHQHQQYRYDITKSYHSNVLQTSNHHYLDTTCQRRELIINFDAVGWAGWVIAPQAYNARYCLGQCPFPLSTHYNTTNHAVLLQLVHLLDVARISGPCCVPHQLSSQSLLYHSQNGDVVLRVYEDMVVESCACR